MSKYEITSVNKVLLPDFQPWTDSWGLMQDNDQGGTTGNGVLFTAHYVYGLYLNDLITSSEKDRLLKVLESCMLPEGILMRTPDNAISWQAHDDYCGFLGAEAMLRPRGDRLLTEKLYEYGTTADILGPDFEENNPKNTKLNKIAYYALKIIGLGKIKYAWNNIRPGRLHVATWLGRRIEMIATMKMSIDKFVNPIAWLYWAYFMLQGYISGFDKISQDGYTTRLHMAKAAQGYGTLTDWVCYLYLKQLKTHYGSLGAVLSDYFGKPHHPIVKLTGISEI